MRILIVEHDFASRLLLQRILSPYGDCDVAVYLVKPIEKNKLRGEIKILGLV